MYSRLLAVLVVLSTYVFPNYAWGIVNDIVNVVRPVVPWIQPVVEVVQPVVPPVVPWIQSLKPVVEPIMDPANTIIKPVVEAVEKVTEDVMGKTDEVAKDIGGAVEKRAKDVGHVSEAIIKEINNAGNSIIDPPGFTDILASIDVTNKDGQILKVLANLDPTNPNGWIQEKFIKSHVHGNYCGPGWCSGEEKAESSCTFQAEPRDCADRCCFHHDRCCGSVGTYGDCVKAGCDSAMAGCQGKCPEDCGMDEACWIAGLGLAVFFQAKQPATCCGHTVDASALDLVNSVAYEVGTDKAPPQTAASLAGLSSKTGIWILGALLFSLIASALVGYFCRRFRCDAKTPFDSGLDGMNLSERLLNEDAPL
eukprot:gb/GEZN01006797.1/.p1 GENE.gb/GEZN01006797.1/~~gb/GEZN01006797.1/.p1  ORF type:complete len:365 (+),score=35.22 gb/GEZN01006797.1/:82-1176(+)